MPPAGMFVPFKLVALAPAGPSTDRGGGGMREALAAFAASAVAAATAAAAGGGNDIRTIETIRRGSSLLSSSLSSLRTRTRCVPFRADDAAHMPR